MRSQVLKICVESFFLFSLSNLKITDEMPSLVDNNYVITLRKMLSTVDSKCSQYLTIDSRFSQYLTNAIFDR